MIQLASETSEIDLAWAAYDQAMLEMVEMYRDPATFSPQDRHAQHVECERLLWFWRRLFEAEMGGDGPRPAA